MGPLAGPGRLDGAQGELVPRGVPCREPHRNRQFDTRPAPA